VAAALPSVVLPAAFLDRRRRREVEPEPDPGAGVGLSSSTTAWQASRLPERWSRLTVPSSPGRTIRCSSPKRRTRGLWSRFLSW